MQELQLSARQLLHIWWLRTWRGFILGLLAVTPFALGFYWYVRSGHRSAWIGIAQALVVTLISAAIAYAVSRMALVKKYPGFRIALMPLDGSQELPLLSRHVLAFWWYLVWRMLLGVGLITLASSRAERYLTPHENIARQVIALGLILAWEFWVLRLALTKRYRDFRIALISD